MSAAPALLALFLVVPLAEIYLLIVVGGWLGAGPTVAMVVLTAVIGVFLLRLQGFSTLERVRIAMAQGQVPALELLEGVALLVAGAFLLTPGFLTDTMGFCLLTPPLRRPVLRRILSGLLAPPDQSAAAGGESPGPRTIEGEFHREDD